MTQVHPVVAALRERPPGARIALVIEGGGMRGAVSGGMALALDDLGLADAFDGVHGASAGALNGMWLVAGRVAQGAATWWDPDLVHTLIEPRRLLRGGRVVDVEALVEERYEAVSPGVFAAVLAARAELHPIATDVATGEAADLHAVVGDSEERLRLALRASASLPVLAGPPVALAGRRYVDAGVAAAIPYRFALQQGATHVLVLRSRRLGEVAQAPGRLSGLVTRAAVGRVSRATATTLAGRAPREAREEAELEALAAATGPPHVLQVRPAPDSPVPGRLERDVGLVREALEGGRAAALEALSPRSGS